MIAAFTDMVLTDVVLRDVVLRDVGLRDVGLTDMVLTDMVRRFGAASKGVVQAQAPAEGPMGEAGAAAN